MKKLEITGPFKTSGEIPAKLRDDLKVGIKPSGEFVTITGTRDDMLVFESEGGTMFVVDEFGRTLNGHLRVLNGDGMNRDQRLAEYGSPYKYMGGRRVTTGIVGGPPALAAEMANEDELDWKDRIMSAVVLAWREYRQITLYALIAASRCPTSPSDTVIKHWIEGMGDADSRSNNLRPYLFSEKPLAFGRERA